MPRGSILNERMPMGADRLAPLEFHDPDIDFDAAIHLCRRSEQRLPLRGVVLATAVNADDEPTGPSMELEARNLSASGIGLTSRRPLACESRMLVEFHCTRGGASACLRRVGRVAYSVPWGNYWLVGVEFAPEW